MGGAAGPDLVAAVAEAGALGTLGGAAMPAGVVAAALDAVAGRTTGAFGVNFLMPFLDLEAVEAAAGRARLVEFFYGDPDPTLVDRVHQGGALAGWQVGSTEEARAAAGAGCDLVVAQGVEAGGHVRGTTGLLPLLESVLSSVEVPVVAAGGIGSARSVAAVLAAGAAGARVGTRFLAAVEADVHPEYLAALAGAAAEDTVLTTAFGAMWPDAPHRVLRCCVEAAEACTDPVLGETGVGDRRFPVMRLSSSPPVRSTTGRIDAMALYAGQSVAMVGRAMPAADIVAELASALGPAVA